MWRSFVCLVCQEALALSTLGAAERELLQRVAQNTADRALLLASAEKIDNTLDMIESRAQSSASSTERADAMQAARASLEAATATYPARVSEFKKSWRDVYHSLYACLIQKGPELQQQALEHADDIDSRVMLIQIPSGHVKQRVEAAWACLSVGLHHPRFARVCVCVRLFVLLSCCFVVHRTRVVSLPV